MDTADQFQILLHGKIWRNGSLLGRYADLFLDLIRLLCNGSAAYGGISRCGFCQTGQHFDGGGFSRTVDTQ